MAIGKILEDLMQQKGTNANELANKIGVPAMTIYSMVKRDSKKADIDVLFKICDALGVDVEIFYEDYVKDKSIKKSSPTQWEALEEQLMKLDDDDINFILEFVEFLLRKKKQGK